ncbi:hypothetical protein P8452_70598 [Trifolium repens]|nr:hypothetical protein P8452_70598 [Trifolium repens]
MDYKKPKLGDFSTSNNSFTPHSQNDDDSTTQQHPLKPKHFPPFSLAPKSIELRSLFWQGKNRYSLIS